MEGGILRDYFDHKLTTKAHFDKLRKPELYTYGELQWDVNHCEETANIDIEYDVVCAPDVTEDCVPKLVISAERLMANETGRAENRKLAELLEQYWRIWRFWLLSEQHQVRLYLGNDNW